MKVFFWSIVIQLKTNLCSLIINISIIILILEFKESQILKTLGTAIVEFLLFKKI